MIKFSFSADEFSSTQSELYAVLCQSSFDINENYISSLQKYVQNIDLLAERYDFKGNPKQSICFVSNGFEELRYVGLYGLGSIDIPDNDYKEYLRVAGAKIINHCEQHKLNRITIRIPEHPRLKKEDCIYEISMGSLLANYHFDDFITIEHKKPKRNHVIHFEVSEEEKKKAEEAVVKAFTIAQAVNQARHWGDLPPSILYPKSFVDQIQKIFKDKKNISIEILNKKDLEKLEMGGVLGVCKGSEHDPYMVVMEYKPTSKKEIHATVALVGKGVTFDTGGISIKPADNMEDMKDDMAGAAAVISTMLAISSLKPNLHIIVCAPLVENMPSGSALKPGDIITFYNKKTAEVKNTDAEGRLILADALSYISEKYKPDFMIDLATLTGACVVALGKFFAGSMTKFDNFQTELTLASRSSGENIWPLPFHDDYKKAIESDVADICNIGKGNYKSGTITAGFFLKNFVPDELPWIHLDIAGVSMHVPDKPYFRSSGATGFGVRLLTEFLTNPVYLEKLKPKQVEQV